MLKLFKSEPALDETTVLWLFDIYQWALDEFDRTRFFEATKLVLPTNEYFPGRENSAQGMADLILDQVAAYAGLAHWPVKAMPQEQFEPLPGEAIAQLGTVRGDGLASMSVSSLGGFVPVPYEADMVLNPEALIASYAHVLSHYLGSLAKTSPPGGAENWAMASEVLGVFLGFGVMMANSAYHAPGGCGSCNARMVARTSYLSQFDITYALAIFATLKDIPGAQVTKHLKTSLRGYFKKAMKELGQHSARVAELKDKHHLSQGGEAAL